MLWDLEKIKEFLPQREPFLFVDGVISVDPEAKKITTQRLFTPEDYFFKGHFPGNPIVPGVITIEALAQSAILLYASLKPEVAKNRPLYYLGKVKAEFKLPVRPNDLMVMEITGLKLIDSAGIVEGKAFVNNQLIAKAEFVFGVKLKSK